MSRRDASFGPILQCMCVYVLCGECYSAPRRRYNPPTTEKQKYIWEDGRQTYRTYQPGAPAPYSRIEAVDMSTGAG